VCKLTLLFLSFLALLGGCQSLPRSSEDAKQRLLSMFQMGKSEKKDLIQEFGSAQWCKIQSSGEESCRFFRSFPKIIMGKGMQRRTYVPFDEAMTEFDKSGKLTSLRIISVR